MFKTPILFLIFNRQENALRVFNKIKNQKPKYLYIAADWPRKDKKWEAEACKKTREEILKQIDWDCELKTLFRDENLWCKEAISTWISRFFDNVNQWIILEDDCVPNDSFFKFCELMLDKYKDDKRIMHIWWTCFQPIKYHTDSYYFTKYNHVRWRATWKRAWNLYDKKMRTFPEFVKKWEIEQITKNYFWKKTRINHLQDTYNNKIDTWDYQWTYSIRINNWLAIQPLKNLVCNIWFEANALHTKNSLWLWDKQTESINCEKIIDPTIMLTDLRYENYTENHVHFVFKVYVARLLKKLWIYKIIANILWYN